MHHTKEQSLYCGSSRCWVQRCLTQNRLRRGVFRALEEFIMAIENYFNRHNENPKRFI